jgi:hypothetical protein
MLVGLLLTVDLADLPYIWALLMTTVGEGAWRTPTMNSEQCRCMPRVQWGFSLPGAAPAATLTQRRMTRED